ncbi:MAG TPA: HAMP domain-containing sensor histidine kinase, partial [Chthoniobacteraceae bacterium]
ALRLLGQAPPWLAKLWPALQNGGRTLPLGEASPFLENFLIDAEECWKKAGDESAQSGPWVEQDAQGGQVELDATALIAAGQPILLLERLGKAFAAKKAVLQQAREITIAHQRLNSEIQKKEILLHCVADEMTAALANVITSLRLIELEDNGPRTEVLLGLATRATEEQQTLIHRILSVFEDELRSAYGSSSLTNTHANWETVFRQAWEAATPLFVEKGVTLKDGEEVPSAVQVPVDPAQLQRVVGNLFENALDRTPPGGTVTVRTENEPEALRLCVEDTGTAITREMCDSLFAKWDPANATAFRLHFCRIVVENCGGEIGCAPLPDGGNQFWIRLTKATTT